jgi:phospholipase A-2-activating protein
VRSLAVIPDIGFASCSNDRQVFVFPNPSTDCVDVIPFIHSEIRVWTLGGDFIYTLSGHTSFVYSLAALPNGDIVSGGEDRTVRVWQGQIFGLF